jgi:hypothetical protein
MEEKNKPETPRCEFKGALPHPVRPAYQLVWDLPSGPVVKWSCAGHRHSFGGNRGYWVNRTEGYEDNAEPRSHELAAPLDVPVESRLGDDAEEGLRSCVDPDCLNPARRGEFCDECQSRWEDEQRAKAAAAEAKSRPRAINQRRGF